MGRKGADVRRETCRGKIPLYAAAEKQFVEIVKEILPFTKERDLFKLTHYGTTAMFIASKQSNKTVKKMLVAFCSNQKKIKSQKESEEDIQSENTVKSEPNNQWIYNQNQNEQRLGTPKFAEDFERFQELKQKRKKRASSFSSKTTPFLERMTNILKIERNPDDEEKEKSVPRIMDNEYPQKSKQRERRIKRRSLTKKEKEKEKETEHKEEANDFSDSEQAHSNNSKPKKCAFDFNRLYRGKKRNESNEENINQKTEKNEKTEKTEKKWKGFSNRFIVRNLVKKNHETQQTESDPDELLQRDQMEKDKKEKAQISQEAVTKFLERQRIKCLEAQKKQKERIIEHKNREKLEREQLARKREEARFLAMRVAEKIKERQNSLSLDVENDDDHLLNDEHQESKLNELDIQSDSCLNSKMNGLNLFDSRLRKKGICNENSMERGQSLSVLEKLKMKKDKKRSLAVTGSIFFNEEENEMLNDLELEQMNDEYLNMNDKDKEYEMFMV